LSAVPVGITDTHQWWRVPVLGHHLLIAGATGAGKGSVLWSLIVGLAPSVKTGQVRLCVVDPKGGMELGAGAALFTAFSHDATDTTLDVLRALVTVMSARANRLRGHSRLHTPTPSEPLFVVIIDEIAALTAYVIDRKIRAEIEHLLGLLLSQGRAVGISVVAAIQDPSKDTLPVRQLFTVRVGLRLTEASQTAMVLGQGARDGGAECELIADTTPGVGYVMIDGTAQPQRVRAFHVTDPDITDLTTRFTPPRGQSNGNEHNIQDAGPDGSSR
jgi:S-DNA-T family DNA segregation ATPase FtsK/SpoIIIE